MRRLIIFAAVMAVFTVYGFRCIQSAGETELPVGLNEAVKVGQIGLPDAFERVNYPENSFPEYLRNLSLRTDNTVYLYNGEKKPNQSAQFRIVELDVGEKDLQQCADAIMRLRAEYLYSLKKYDEIHFNFTSGDPAHFSKYASGYRARISGNDVSWVKSAAEDYSYSSFRSYCDLVFTYAGTASLIKELNKVKDFSDIQSGDILIQTGNPYGHAVLILDIAINKSSGEKIYMLGQSYMPAQNFHVLLNPESDEKTPWYTIGTSERIQTPEWSFTKSDLYRFVD